MLCAFNQGDKFVLAIVLVDGDDSTDGLYYGRCPFDQEPRWGCRGNDIQPERHVDESVR
jgi:hypothetical protein